MTQTNSSVSLGTFFQDKKKKSWEGFTEVCHRIKGEMRNLLLNVITFSTWNKPNQSQDVNKATQANS